MITPTVSPSYDVLILGSGISGSTLCLPLSQRGLRVLVIDEKKHPRFAIGEAMVPTTSNGFERLAREYDIPELGAMFKYSGLKTAGCAGFPKQQFFYGIHRPGEELAEHEQCMMETLELPVGPDVHMYRQDVDAYLAACYPKYGVDLLEETRLVERKVDSHGIDCVLEHKGQRHASRVRLIVDASGGNSKLAQELGLKPEKPELKTNTRALFGHFADVSSLEETVGRPNPAFRLSRDAGTVHHCFEGGWMWVIPFDNGLTSLGVVLDCDAYPLDPSVPAEQEFDQWMRRFPTVERQLGKRQLKSRLIRSDRIQVRMTGSTGPGIVLGPNTLGFVDPLFSTGFNLVQAYAQRFVPRVVEMLADPNYNPTTSLTVLEPVGDALFAELELVDCVVDAVIKSFRNYDVFKQAWRTWAMTSVLQFHLRLGSDTTRCGGTSLIYGAGVPEWNALLHDVHALVTSQDSDEVIARKLKQRLDGVPQAFNPAYMNYAIGSPRACVGRSVDRNHLDFWRLSLLKMPGVAGQLDLKKIVQFIAESEWETLKLPLAVAWSRWVGTPYHRQVESIQAQFIDQRHPKESRFPPRDWRMDSVG